MIFHLQLGTDVNNINFESPTLTSTMYKDAPKILCSERIGGLFDKEGKKHQAGSVWNSEGLSPTLDTMQGWMETTECNYRTKTRN